MTKTAASERQEVETFFAEWEPAQDKLHSELKDLLLTRPTWDTELTFADNQARQDEHDLQVAKVIDRILVNRQVAVDAGMLPERQPWEGAPFARISRVFCPCGSRGRLTTLPNGRQLCPACQA